MARSANGTKQLTPQEQGILNLLNNGEKLTRKKALDAGYGIELPARVFYINAYLRNINAGYQIQSQMIKLTSGVRVAVYFK